MDTSVEALHALALSGFSAAAGAEVVAHHTAGDYAVVYVVPRSGTEQGEYMGTYRRAATGWRELAGGDAGGEQWTDTSAEDSDVEVGVLAAGGQLAKPGRLRVECEGQVVDLDCLQPYWVACFPQVSVSAGVRLLQSDG